jgi:hypothetical protein
MNLNLMNGDIGNGGAVFLFCIGEVWRGNGPSV